MEADQEFIHQCLQDELSQSFQGEVVEGEVVVAPPSPTVFELDRWSRRQGREAFDSNERLQATCEQTQENGHELAADLFAAAFEPEPKFAECNDVPVRERFVRPLMANADWRRMRDSTVLNHELSQLAVESAATQYAAYLVEEDQQQDSGEGADERGEARAAAAANRAAQDASQDVQDFNDTQQAIGCGRGSGELGAVDMRRAVERFRKLKNNPQWMNIVRQAGRYRHLCQSLQRNKLVHGQDEVVGIELGGKVGRLVPSELARLCDDDLCDEALIRLSQNQCMQRELRAVEREGLGPIMVCVDESSSMAGERWESAAALSIALAWLAREQGRAIMLSTFSGDDQTRRVVINPGDLNVDRVIGWACGMRGGGTCDEVPVWKNRVWLNNQRSLNRTFTGDAGRVEYVIITDGEFPVDPHRQRSFLKWAKRQQVHTTCIAIGVGRGFDLEKCVDIVHYERDLGIETDGVADVLSI